MWGVDTTKALDELVDGLARELDVNRGDDGVARFVPSFGIPMGLCVFVKTPVVCAPDPLNAPGYIRRLNQKSQMAASGSAQGYRARSVRHT